MDDSQIIALYWQRDERAIPATAEAYGGYCFRIADNILHEPQDAEECLNDVWLRAWNTIPPHRPKLLSAFLGRITRNRALNMYASRSAQKRGGGNMEVVFEELAECVSGRDSVEDAVAAQALGEALNAFLASMPTKKRKVFLRRYWYADSVAEIARTMGMTENHVSVLLHRQRAALKQFLTERGFDL